MDDPSHPVMHEGLTELLRLKRQMLRTVFKVGLIVLAAAVVLALVVVLAQWALGEDTWYRLRFELREHLRL
jgi:hypothetical protein